MTLDRNITPALAERWIREALRLHPGGAELTISGTCMEPAIPEGARVRLIPLAGSPRFGDVLLLTTPSGIRLHRVLFRRGAAFRTKGDRGFFLDPPLKNTNILARVQSSETWFERRIRALVSVARLALRPVRGPRSDRAHAEVLPPGDSVKYAGKDPVDV